MSVAFSIPLVDQALGNSVIYEEYKGNYATARRIAEEKVAETRQGEDRVAGNDALLALGVVQILQGETSAARKTFSELEAQAAENPALELRLSGYRYLVEQLHLGTFPDNTSASSIEIDARGGLLHIAEIFEQTARRQELWDTVADSAMRIERELLYKLSGTSRVFRGYLRSGTGREHLEAWLKGGPLGFLNSAKEWNADPRLLAFAYLTAADLCACGRKNEQAQDWLHQAQTEYAKAGDLAGIAICRMLQGDQLCALFSTPEVWNHAIQEGGMSGSNLDPSIESAEFNRRQIQTELARAAYVEAEQEFGQAGAIRGLAALQLRYGYLAMLDGDYDRAAQHALAAKAYFETTGDHLGANLASAHHALSRAGGGHLPEETASARAIGEWGRDIGSFSYALGLGLLCAREGRRWLLTAGEYERALACFRLAEALFDALGAPTNTARVLMDQASIFQGVGEVAAARERCEKASNLHRRILAEQPAHAQSVWFQAVLLGKSIYNLYQTQTDPDGMERTAAGLHELLSQAPVSPDPNVLGELTASADKITVAEAKNQSMALQWQLAAMTVQTTLQIAYVLIPDYRGLQAREAGDKERARQQFETALARAAQIRTQDTVSAAVSVLAHLERWEEAATLYRQYLDAQMQSAARGLESSAVGPENSMFLLVKQQLHQQAVIGFTGLKAYREALTHLSELERSLGENWWQNQEQPWEPLAYYGEVHEGLGQLDQAQAHYDQAIAVLEDRRGRLTRDELKTALAAVKNVQRVYFYAARTTAKQYQAALPAGDPATAQHLSKLLEYAERGKARALLDLLAADGVLAASTPGESQALRGWRKITTQLTLWHGLLAQERNKRDLERPDQQRIEELNDKIMATEAELRQAEAQLAQAAPNFYRAVNPRAAIISLDDVITRLPPDTALLQYYFLGEDLLSWVITQQGVRRLHRAELDTRALAREIRAFHRACATRSAVDELGSALVQTLLMPFASEIRDHAHLIIVPYGAAHVLPFHALPWEGQPLAATHTVSYLPSTSALQYLGPEQAGRLPNRILAIGNPAEMAYKPPLGGEATKQKPLPAAELEAAAVAGLFGDNLLLLNEKATESAVREHITDFPLLHFATHGYLSEDAPLLSSILLANGGGLTVYELMGLRLNADLVVLSACETARGKTTDGDDVIGLTRGLLAAGARAAVVSLWRVDDLSTSLLMSHFYVRLRVGDAPAVALQAAQKYLRELTPERAAEELSLLKVAVQGRGAGQEVVDLISGAQATVCPIVGRPEGVKSPTRDYRHPFYWAPFILVG